MISLKRWVVFFLMWAGVGLVSSVQAQSGPAGEWTGAIQVPGRALDVVVTLAQENGAWTGAIDIPAQGARDLPLRDIVVDDGHVAFTIAGVPGTPSFNGAVTDGGTTLSGDFTQSGQKFPFVLTRVTEEDRAAAGADQAAALDSLRAYLPAAMDTWKVPGLAMAIVKDGEVIFSEGFGQRDVAGDLPVTPQTLFAIGSSTKAFTSTLIGTLVDDGTIAWDEPVADYMKGFKLEDPFATQRMTVVDLLTHRSGLPRHDLMWYNAPFSREELFRRLQYLEPNEDFRTTWQYQNLMFMTAGYLAEQVTGRSWEDLVRARVFEPLGMTHSNFSVDVSQQSEDVAMPYGERDDVVEQLPFRNIDAVGPAGSINSNLVDMAQWVKLQLSDGALGDQRVVTEGTLKKIHAPHIVVRPEGQYEEIPFTLYGLGWFVQPYRGRVLVQHGGNIDGFSALVSFMPHEGVGLVVLTNKNATPMPTIAALRAYDLLLGPDVIDWSARYKPGDEGEDAEEGDEEEAEDAERVAGTSPSHPLEAYAGTYEHPAYGDLTISVADDSLRFAFHGFEGALEHWHYDVFAVADEASPLHGTKLNFSTNVKGDVEGVAVPLEPSVAPIVFTRKPSEKLSDPDYLTRFTGTYDVMGKQLITVALAGDHLTADIPGQPSYELEPYDEGEFNLKGLNGFSIRFVEEDGTVVRALITQPNGTVSAKKVEE